MPALPMAQLDAALARLQERFQNLLELRQRLEASGGGSSSYLQRVNNELQRTTDLMNAATRQINNVRTFYAGQVARRGPNQITGTQLESDELHRTLNGLNDDFDRIGRTVLSTTDKVDSFEKKLHATAFSWDKYMVSQEDIMQLSPQLEEEYQNIREQLINAVTSDEVEQAILAWERFKKSLRDVASTASSVNKAFKDAQKAQEEAQKAQEEANKAMMLGMVSAADNLAATIKAKVLNGLWNTALTLIKNVIEATKTLDAELVEIRKVTDFNETELSAFVKNIQDIGNRTATTTSQLLEATAVFARSGYTKQQITQLTEEAAVLKNVSDGITDMSQAAETLISVMKAYHIEAENARSITDTLNAISNKSAISFDDLAEGLSRVGSVFASQDTSIAQLSAMLTGANEILQNIEKTSTGLKTISQRLRGISDDTNEEGVNLAKLQDIVSGITEKYGETVRITDEHTGQLRGTYDIISDLANVWGQMTKNEQQLLGEKIAGKTQITVLQALLNNWESVKNAIDNAKYSTGSAAREQEAYINSLTGALNQFKAMLENIYANIFDSKILSGFVNLGTGILNIINKIGVNPIIAGFLTGGITGKIQSFKLQLHQTENTFKTLVGDFKLIDLLSKQNIKDILSYTKGLGKTVDFSTIIAQEHRDAYEDAVSYLSKQASINLSKQEQVALESALKVLSQDELRIAGQQVALQRAAQTLAVAKWAAIAFIVAGVIKLLANQHTKAMEKLNSHLSEYNSKIEEIQNKIKEINDEIESSGGETTQKQIENLEKLNAELEVTIRLAKKAREELVFRSSDFKSAFGTETLTGKSETLGWDFKITNKDFEKFYDDQGVFIKEKLDEAYDFYKNYFEAVKEISDTTGSEIANNFVERFSKMWSDVQAELNRQNTKITLGVTKDSLEEYLVTAFKGIEWSAIIGNIDDSVINELFNKIFPFNDINNINKWEELSGRLWDIVEESVGKWQEHYSAIMAVDRALGEYRDLYAQATSDMSADNLLNILENWEKYADILAVDVNGNLIISKELVKQRFEAELDATKKTLERKAQEVEIEIAREEAAVKAIENIIKRSKNQVIATNAEIEANLKLNEILRAQNNTINGIATQASLANVDINKWVVRMDDLNTSLDNQREYLKNLRAQIDAINNMDIDAMLKSASSGTSKAASATSELNDELSKLKDILSTLQKQMTDTTDVYKKVQSAMKDIVQAEIDALEDENDALEDGMKYYDARIKLIEEYYESGIDELKKQKEAAVDANEAEQKALEDKIDALKTATEEYEKQNKAEQDAIDEQVKALEAQIDAIDEANDAREKELEMQERLLNIEKARLAMEKAKDAYEAAKASKTVRTYDAERGWIYTADQAAVQSAYGEYQSAQENYQNLLDELAKAQAEAEIQAQKDAIQAQIDALKEQKDVLKEQLEQTKEAADAQEDLWDKEIDILKDQKDEIKDNFEKQIDELEKQSDKLSNIEDDVDRMLDKYLNDEDVVAWVEAYKNASEEERAAMEAELRSRWAADKSSQMANEDQIANLKTLIKDIEGMLETTESILDSEGVKAWLESFKAGGFDERENMVEEMRRAYLEFYENQQAEIDKVQQAIDKLEGTISITNTLLENWGTGKEHTPVNSYANGGVVDSGLLMNTGMLSNRVKVHGTPSSPEVILNGRQQANLLYRLGQQKPTVMDTRNVSNATSMYIATLNIQADSQDTLQGLLLQAKQLATIS